MSDERMSFSIRRLAKEMEKQLAANAHKGHWRDCNPDFLFGELQTHVDELRKRYHMGTPPGTIWHEAADVANFLMMLADNFQKDEPPVKPPEDAR